MNDNVIWVSGSNGTVGRSANAGRTWKWSVIPGYEKVEFRDIEGFDGLNAVVMGIASPAYILKTSDGGETWKRVYENPGKDMFLDAMDFENNLHGIVIGDPIGGKVFVAETFNSGETWQEWPVDKRPSVDSGEAFFAASGTNIRLFRKNKFFLVSGGTKSRLFTAGNASLLPLVQGKETTGANSIAVFDEGAKKGSKKMVVVGGDFAADSTSNQNCFYTTDGGKSWKAPSTPPHGYRSSVEYLSNVDLLSCGINGVDFSMNGGKTWVLISKEGFNVCRIAKFGPSIFLAGGNGKVGKVIWR